MAVTRPSRYPIVAQTPGGNYAEPGSGVQLGGWATGAIFPSADANWLMRQITDWGRSLDASRLASTDLLDANVVQRVSTTALTITTGGGTTLTAAITAGGVYYGKGERIDLTDAATVYTGGNALVFPAASTRYVIARPQPATGGAVSGSSTAELAISAVTPVAGWSTLMTVTTGAATITSAVQHGDVLDAFQFGRPIIFADTLETLALATFSAPATFDDLTDFNAKTTFTDVSEWSASSSDPLILLTPTGSGGGLEIAAAGGTGVGLAVTGGTAAAALAVSGAFAGGYAMTVAGTGGAGGLFVQGNGVGWGLAVNSGATAGSYGLVAIAQNDTGNAIYAVSANSGTAPAIKGAGSNLAAGVEAAATAYYPLLLSPDVSSPAYGHLFGDPQNAPPSQVGLGALACVAGAINGWGQANNSESAWRWFHASPGGYAYGAAYQQSVSSTSSVSYSNLALADLTGMNAPKVAGAKVRIAVKLRFRTTTAVATGVDIRVIDFTADPGGASPLILFEGSGTGTTSGMYLSGVNTNYNETFSFEFDYTIPATGDRSFILQIRRWGGVTVTGHGSITVDGV